MPSMASSSCERDIEGINLALALLCVIDPSQVDGAIEWRSLHIAEGTAARS